MRKQHVAALLLSLLLAIPTAQARSAAQVYRFKQMEPCPATGKSRGPCPGWQVDHITPLCAGGDDKTWNMQWLSVADHKFKTFLDVKQCRQGRSPHLRGYSTHRQDQETNSIVVIPQKSVITHVPVVLNVHA